jgi:ubiquinone/menaquinone biosynthesis C-methylase UbiE
MSPVQDARQDPLSAAQNSEYFSANAHYARHVASLDTYRAIRAAVDAEIKGSKRLLDVGNGGVFDYDTDLAEQIVGVDLCLSETSPAPAQNISLRRGDALALDEPDASYDCVLEISVFHHLIGSDVQSTMTNISRAVEEAYRVLEPGGRLVVMESCVSQRAFAVERRLFSSLRWLANTPVMQHPATLQFPANVIAGIIENRFDEVSVAPIPVGRWILQFGVRWPAVLTPARPYLFTATRL